MNQHFRILYAEDEPDLREITTELLRTEGYDITAVADGLEAMRALEKENFDLLISDFQMPKIDGALLLMWCRETGRHFPVIFISGNMERLPIENLALDDCCATLLHKPVAFDHLIEKIEKAKLRIHEYDCLPVKAYNPHVDKHKKNFPGQHYIEPNKH